MKKFRKIMSALLAMSIVFALLAVNASAAEPTLNPSPDSEVVTRAATPTARIDLPTNRSRDSFALNIVDGYNYWKIAIQTSTTSTMKYQIFKDSPHGEVVYESNDIPAGNSSEHGWFPAGNYYVEIYVVGGGSNLQGILWYKTATTENEVL